MCTLFIFRDHEGWHVNNWAYLPVFFRRQFLSPVYRQKATSVYCGTLVLWGPLVFTAITNHPIKPPTSQLWKKCKTESYDKIGVMFGAGNCLICQFEMIPVQKTIKECDNSISNMHIQLPWFIVSHEFLQIFRSSGDQSQNALRPSDLVIWLNFLCLQ